MSNLLSRADADIQIAKMLMSPAGNPTDDELITDQAAYHIQQGIEKALKYQTEMMGISYSKTHNLVGLISRLEKEGHPEPNALKSTTAEDIKNLKGTTNDQTDCI